MHPAIYSALTEARESELRAAAHHEFPARRARQPRRRFSLRIAFRARRVARA